MKVVAVSALLVGVMIWGLSRMAGNKNGLSVSGDFLANGAKLIKTNGETRVRVAVFSDMECPACARADAVLRGLRDKEGVEFVYRHYPLSIHRNSVIAARAVEAARLMGKGWEMIDLLFDKQNEWFGVKDVEKKLTEYAVSLGLEAAMFTEKLVSEEVKTVVEQDMTMGDGLQLSGTPTVYVNGELVAPDFVISKVEQLLK